MTASISHFVASSSVVAKGLPPRATPGAPQQGEEQGGAAAPSRPLRKAQGDVQTKPALPTEHSTAGPTEAFSRAWAKALEQSELTTAKRLQNTKGLAMPLATAKASPKEHTNDNVVASVFTNQKTDALPLLLSFSAPQAPQSDQKNALTGNAGAKNGFVSRVISTPEPDKPERLQTKPGEVAFTATIKSPASKAGNEGSAVASSSATPAVTSNPPQGNDATQLVKTPVDAAPVILNAQSAPTEGLTSSVKVSSISRLEPIAPPDEAKAIAPQPMKEIALQLPGARGVEIRLSERAGEVRIDVRSGDVALTQDLRGNLHDLVSSLERKGFATEVSHLPEHASAPASRSADTGASKDQSSGGQSGAFDRQPQQRNRHPGQPAEPPSSKARASAWTQQANSSFGKENQ